MCKVYDLDKESFSYYFRENKNTLTQEELKDIKFMSGKCEFEILENRIVLTPEDIKLFNQVKYELAQKYRKKLRIIGW